MPQPETPEVPPAPLHRSAGDTGAPQRGEMTDDLNQAVESGEPDETQRSRGRVTDENGMPAGGNKKARPQKDEHWESGRHEAE